MREEGRTCETVVLSNTSFKWGRVRKARKQYICHYCGTAISPGEKYVERRPFWSGEVWRICMKHIDEKELVTCEVRNI